MKRLVLAAIILSVPMMARAEPPILGQATLYPGQYPGPGGHHVFLGVTAMGKTVAEASQITWVVESEGKEQWSVRVDCTDKYSSGSVPLCEVPIPVLQDVHRIRVRAAGTTEWSGVWQMAMIPCGFFVGEPVFRNSKEIMGWWSPSFGGACAVIPTPDPAPPVTVPGNPRILQARNLVK